MAVSVLVCAGSQFNTVARVLALSTGQVVASDNNSLFPTSYLGDNKTELAFRFSTTSSGTIRVDQNLVLNGSMETATTTAASTLLANWVIDSGTIIQSSSQASRGSWSMKLSGLGQAHEDVEVNAGERFTITAAGFGDGTNSPRIQAYNTETFNYLTSSGGWQVAQAYCITPSTAAAWTTGTVVTTIEAYSPTVLRDTMTLRISAVSTGSTVYLDDVYYWPSTSLVAALGFLNLDPGIVVTVQSSTDGFTTTTTETTMTQYTPAMFYAPSTPIDKRHIGLKFAGVNSTGTGPIYGSELVLGQVVTLTRPYSPSKQLRFIDSQTRSQSVFGNQQIVRLDQHPAMEVTVPYTFTTLAEYQQIRDQIYRRSGFGTYPMVMIPSSTDPETCIFGHVEEQWTVVEGPMVNYWEGSKLVIVGRQFPVWVS